MRKPEAWLRVAAVADAMAEATAPRRVTTWNLSGSDAWVREWHEEWVKLIREWHEELRQACAESQTKRPTNAS